MANAKSAVKEVRDQLFLDTAVGEYLTALASNFGVNRPKLGFTDDNLWRAMVRFLAVDYKSITSVFHLLMSNIFGPRISVATVLSADVAVEDDELSIDSWLNIPQRGTMVIDPGMPTQETLAYSFRDPTGGAVALKDAAALAHTALDIYTSSYLISAVTSGAIKTLVLESASKFPDPAVVGPYPVLIDAGMLTEEVAKCTAKSGNSLTVASLSYGHSGPSTMFATTTMVGVSTDKRLLFADEVDRFDSEGILYVQQSGGSPSEFVPYDSIGLADGYFDLYYPLTSTYALPTSVTAAKHGASVQMAQVLVRGAGWDVILTEEHKIKLFIPPTIIINRLVDAPYLHDKVSSPPSTTLSSPVSAGDTELPVSSSTSFPDSGVVEIDSAGTSELISYGRVDRFTAILGAGGGTGSTKVFVDSVANFEMAFSLGIRSVVVGEGTGGVETATVSSIDPVTNSLVISALSNTHVAGAVLRMGDPNILYLDRPLELGHLTGLAVDLYRRYLPTPVGNTVESGEIFSATKEARFQGKYLWSLIERASESTKTALAENVAGPTYLLVSQQAGRTALEVKDASFFNASDFSVITVGINVASREDIQINNITLRSAITGRALGAGATAGDTVIQLNNRTGFPQAYGYRVFISNTISGTHEEIAIVKEYSSTPNVLILEDPLLYNHNINEPVFLMADVLTVDSLFNDQEGLIAYSQRKRLVPMIGTEWATQVTVGPLDTNPAMINELRSYINVVSAAAAQFSGTGEYVKINFGKGLVDAESQLSSDYAAGVSAVVVRDGSKMPASDFWVIVGEDTREVERRHVATRAANTLNLSVATTNKHRAGEWVRFFTGDEEDVYYQSKVTGGLERFEFDPPVAFKSNHQIGESVSASRNLALPSKFGTDFPFYLPSNWADRLQFVFDLARAAGVQVVMVSDR